MRANATSERYRYWRAFGHPASLAMSYVREEQRMQATADRLESWQFEQRGDYGAFAWTVVTDAPAPFTIKVLVGDDEPTDWGDCEPTDDERENASSYFVAVEVTDGNGDEVHSDSIGGVDVIDLDGYLQRDWEDAVAFALNEYLLPEAERIARTEGVERAHWAARDTVTV